MESWRSQRSQRRNVSLIRRSHSFAGMGFSPKSAAVRHNHGPEPCCRHRQPGCPTAGSLFWTTLIDLPVAEEYELCIQINTYRHIYRPIWRYRVGTGNRIRLAPLSVGIGRIPVPRACLSVYFFFKDFKDATRCLYQL